MTPDALIDSGELDLSVVSAQSSLGAMMQVIGIMLRGRPSRDRSKSSRNAYFHVRAPASVDLQLDGSAVTLKKYLTAGARDALTRAGDPARVMVNYRFDAVPGALRVAVPRTYNGLLFRPTPL